MLNEKFTFCFKMTIKWNLKKSHATRLKSAKYKTQVIKEQLLKWLSYNKINQSHGLSYYCIFYTQNYDSNIDLPIYIVFYKWK